MKKAATITELITKGYKVTDKDFTCNKLKYELDKVFTHSGEVKICSSGFHFCVIANDCFNYYSFTSENRVFEIEAYGDLDTQGDKSCCGKIKFIRELAWSEVLTVVNTGKDNTGRGNTGYRNTGDWNTGDSNTGDRNTGAFCTGVTTIKLFDKDSTWTVNDFESSLAFSLMSNYVDTKMWVYENSMTEEEKKSYPSFQTAGGYLKDIPFKEAFTNAWHNWSEKNRKAFTSLPNFDAEIFEKITGVKINS